MTDATAPIRAFWAKLYSGSTRGREEWELLIREAQAVPHPTSWLVCEAVVCYAKAIGDEAVVRDIALAWYEAKAVDGDREATECLLGYAIMADDEELKGRFRYTPERPTEVVTEHADRPPLTEDMLAKLGLAGYTFGARSTIALPVLRYYPPA